MNAVKKPIATIVEDEALEAQFNVEEFYGDKPLRWVQLACRNGAIQAIEEGIKTILIVLPTGVGKTITIACTIDCNEIRTALKIEGDRPIKVLFVAHIHRLLTQAERTFAEANNIELMLRTPFTKIEQQDIDDCDIIILDEAHHEAMASIQYQLDSIRRKPLIGLTATEDRSDGMVIKFERIIKPITREYAVRKGWLAETSLWSFIDTSGRNKVMIAKQIMSQYHTIMGKTIVFVKTRAELAEIHQHALNLGRKSVALLNQTPQELDRILDGFSSNEYDFIVNCSKIGEGIDVKGCTSVMLMKQFRSYTQLNQYVGRAARPDSECYVFELINPLKGNNLDTTIVTGTPKQHLLCSWNSIENKFNEFEFEYTNTTVIGIEKTKK